MCERIPEIPGAGGLFERIPCETGRVVEERGEHKLHECLIDATFSERRAAATGSGVRRPEQVGTIMVLVDGRGVPVTVDTCSASQHESTLMHSLVEFMLMEETPDCVVGDRAFDRDELDEAMAKEMWS